jgi:hypothetical protein
LNQIRFYILKNYYRDKSLNLKRNLLKHSQNLAKSVIFIKQFKKFFLYGLLAPEILVLILSVVALSLIISFAFFRLKEVEQHLIYLQSTWIIMIVILNNLNSLLF